MRRVVAASLLGVLGMLALPAAPASAHAALVRTSPLQGSIVQSAPAEVLVTFSENVTPVMNKTKVIGPDGVTIDQGNTRVAGNVLHIPVRTNVPQGTYLVSYRVISADSHPVGAGFSYSVGAPSTTVGTFSDAGRTDPVVATAISAGQYLGYAGLILVAGPALILFALWPRRLDRRGPTRMAYLGLGLIALAAVLELYLEAPYSAGTGLFQVSGGSLGEVLTSRYGVAHLVRLGVVAACVPLLRPHLAGRGGKVGQAGLVVLGAIGVGTWSIAGHPGTSSAPALTVIADVAHLTSVAIWLGGLLVLTGYLLRKANAGELQVILPVWSNWATMAVAVLVLAGTAQALVEIGTVGALLHTRYGQLVLLKVGLLAVVLAFAAVSRQLVRRKPQAVTVSRLRRSVLAEVLGAVLILGVASVLVQTTPARTATVAATQQNGGPFSVTLTSTLYQLQIDIDPATTGDNEIHLFAYTPQGAPLKVLEWKGSAALPARNLEPISISLLPLTDSHSTGQIALPTAGSWQFSFTLRTTDIDEATVSTAVTVK